MFFVTATKHLIYLKKMLASLFYCSGNKTPGIGQITKKKVDLGLELLLLITRVGRKTCRESSVDPRASRQPEIK